MRPVAEFKSVISEDEQRALRLFCAVCDRLPEMRFFQDYQQKEHKLTLNNEDGSITYTKYDDENLRAYLTEFRKLTLTKEPTHLYRILKILARHGNPQTQQNA